MAATFTELLITLVLGVVEKCFWFLNICYWGQSPFLFPIRLSFNTISKSGTNMYYIGELRTHNGTKQYMTCIIVHYVTTRTHDHIV